MDWLSDNFGQPISIYLSKSCRSDLYLPCNFHGLTPNKHQTIPFFPLFQRIINYFDGLIMFSVMGIPEINHYPDPSMQVHFKY